MQDIKNPAIPRPIPSPDVEAQNEANFQALGPVWARHSRENFPVISSDFREKPSSILDFPIPADVRRDLVALVSSGPSLDAALPDLREFPGLVLAGVTALGTLLASGIRPHALVAVDSGPALVSKLRLVPRRARLGIPLLTTPFSHPELLTEFEPADRYYFHAFVDGGKTLVCPSCKATLVSPFAPASYPWNLAMSWLFPEFSVWILQGGSVGNTLPEIVSRWQEAHPEIGQPPLIPASARLLLYGYDFSYPAGRARSIQFTWTEDEDGSFHPIPAPPAPLHTPVELVKAQGVGGRWTLTDWSALSYKRSLLAWWYMTHVMEELVPQDLRRVGSSGILHELPEVAGWREAAETPALTRSEVEDIYAAYSEINGFQPGVCSGREGYELTGPELDLEFWKEAGR